MVYVQEIIFGLSNGLHVRADIEQHQFAFVGEYLLPPVGPGDFPTKIRCAIQHGDAKDCFEWVAGEVQRFAVLRGSHIASVNNPCNAPFISRQDEADVLLMKLNLQPTVLVNGAA